MISGKGIAICKAILVLPSTSARYAVYRKLCLRWNSLNFNVGNYTPHYKCRFKVCWLWKKLWHADIFDSYLHSKMFSFLTVETTPSLNSTFYGWDGTEAHSAPTQLSVVVLSASWCLDIHGNIAYNGGYIRICSPLHRDILATGHRCFTCTRSQPWVTEAYSNTHTHIFCIHIIMPCIITSTLA